MTATPQPHRPLIGELVREWVDTAPFMLKGSLRYVIRELAAAYLQVCEERDQLRERPQHRGHWCEDCQDEVDHG